MVNINAYAITPVKGDTSLPRTGMVISARVKSDEATAIVAGQAVKIVDSAGGVPVITALTATTDAPFGVALYNIKDQSYAANAALEIGMRNTTVWMEAAGAIARGAFVQFDYATNKVSLNLGLNPTLGVAMDKATADGDLIRVLLDIPAQESATA